MRLEPLQKFESIRHREMSQSAIMILTGANQNTSGAVTIEMDLFLKWPCLLARFATQQDFAQVQNHERAELRKELSTARNFQIWFKIWSRDHRQDQLYWDNKRPNLHDMMVGPDGLGYRLVVWETWAPLRFGGNLGCSGLFVEWVSSASVWLWSWTWTWPWTPRTLSEHAWVFVLWGSGWSR